VFHLHPVQNARYSLPKREGKESGRIERGQVSTLIPVSNIATFSFDFKEESAQPCVLELQVKSPDTVDVNGVTSQHAINFTKLYRPGSNNWDTISASLDQFTEPGYFPFGPFDPTPVSSLVLNVQMLQANPPANVSYVGWFDNVRFHGPETVAPGVTTYGLYSSANDSFRIESILLNPMNNSLTISWTGGGILQSAGNVAGSWSDVDGATSPAKLPLSGSARFYRLRR
jgi:hypothetical protein